MTTIEHAWLWRRLDTVGHEGSHWVATGSGQRVCGTALYVDAGRVCHLGYALNTDARWRFKTVHVFGTLDRELIDLSITAGGQGPWRVNGVPQPGTARCSHLDLGFTPSTLMVALRRLSLAAGQSVNFGMAQLDLANRRLVPARRVVKRVGDNDYLAHARAADLGAIVRVDARLAVLHYPGRWAIESGAIPTGTRLGDAQRDAANGGRDREEQLELAREAA